MKLTKLLMEKFDTRHIEETPSTYLGSQWTELEGGRTKFHNEKHTKEIIRKFEAARGGVSKKNIPLLAGHHPETDESRFLTGKETKEFQRWASML